MVFLNKRKFETEVLREGFLERGSRRCLERSLREYGPLGMRPNHQLVFVPSRFWLGQKR